MGRALRRELARHPAAAEAADRAGRVMAPAFRGLVVALIAVPRTRRTGITAGAAAVAAAGVARVLRDRIGRPRPGVRTEGGFPSRHAAAATAIARATGRDHPFAGAVLLGAAAVGMVGRVQTRDHDPADLAAGAATGWIVAAVVTRAAGHVLPARPETR